MSSFRIICVAALTAPLFILLADAAPAQNASANASGTPYLAGLRPPHEPHKATGNKPRAADAAKKTINRTADKTAHKPAARTTRHARTRPAATASARVAWPQVDPALADDRRVPDTALQFRGDDGDSNYAQPNAALTAPRATASPKAPPPKAQERNIIAPAANDQAAAGDQPAATSKVVQVERADAAPQEIARVEAQPPIEALAAASVADDSQPKPADKRTLIAPTLAMLAGAISAALFGSWLFGFGSARRIKLGV